MPNDILSIAVGKSCQTTPVSFVEDDDIQILLDYKNSYNELLVVHQQIIEKYDEAKLKFAQLKERYERVQNKNEQMRSTIGRTNFLYRDLYYEAEDKCQKQIDLNSQLREEIAELREKQEIFKAFKQLFQ